VVRRRRHPAQWPDIWLHEGFATWSEWIWTERHAGPSAAQRFAKPARTPASDDGFWNPAPANPGAPENLFDGTTYDRGAMTLQALREKIGDGALFAVLRRWYAEHKYGNVATSEFIALAQQESGQDLGPFFQAWLYTPGKPAFLPDGDAAPAVQIAADPSGGRR
jgi:aminopeptidase N